MFTKSLLVLGCLLSLALVSAQTQLPVSKWGVPSLEDESCVLCQYVVQRAENQLIQTLEQIDAKVNPNAKSKINTESSTSDPFAPPQAPSPVDPGSAKSVGEAAGIPGAPTGGSNLYNMDLNFKPSLQYKKKLIESMQHRWMGKSILRKTWTSYVAEFCNQTELPEMYVPFCGLLYKNSYGILNAMYYGFPYDQVCLMAKMCGPKSYFATPTAVHNPVMSMYLNNMRGPAGFTGGEHGTQIPPTQL